MKKVAIIFLLFIFLFNTVGYYIVFKTIQYQIKSEVQFELKSGFDSDELETLTIDKSNITNIEWLEPGKEMRYNNQLWDIVKSTETSSSIIFYCINDAKEKSLFTKLEDHIKTHVATKSSNDDPSKKSIDTTVKLYFLTDFSFSYIKELYNNCFFTPNSNYTSVFIKTNSPPPEFV